MQNIWDNLIGAEFMPLLAVVLAVAVAWIYAESKGGNL